MVKLKAKAQVEGLICGVKTKPMSFKKALELDVECLGEEPSDDELIKDEQRRERAYQKARRKRRARQR